MSHPRPWFRQGELSKTFKVGNTIELSKPEPSTWTITEISEEDDHPRHESDGVPTCTSAKLSCEEVRSSSERGPSRRRAFIRVYVQIPYIDTEFEDLETRRREAVTRYKSDEMIALQNLSKCDPPVTPTLLGWHHCRQGSEWPVPGGFVLHYAWQLVDVVRLDRFWHSDRAERDRIRDTFQNLYRQWKRIGVWPTDAAPDNLLWDPDSRKLFRVDRREWGLSVKLKSWTNYLFARF